jgi:hypothetical protein
MIGRMELPLRMLIALHQLITLLYHPHHKRTLHIRNILEGAELPIVPPDQNNFNNAAGVITGIADRLKSFRFCVTM